MSFKTKPQVAAKKAVVAPTKVITNKAVELYSKIGDDLSNKYNPAVTNVQIYNSKILLLNLDFVLNHPPPTRLRWE